MFSDPILQKLMKKYPKPHFEDRSDFLMRELISSVIAQQLSIKASSTIFDRFIKLFPTREFPTAKMILTLTDEKIKSAGLSFAKVGYVKSIAYAFESGSINIDRIRKQSDKEVISELTQIKGIGIWSAEMILIFSLKRPDVFSIGDLGLRKAIEKLYGISDRKEMLSLSKKWTPHRSTASWYLWRSLENSN